MMPSESAERLSEAQALARAGQWREARLLLYDVLGADPNNLDAWLWLAAIAEHPLEAIGHLRRALQINPNSLRAQKGMEWAQARLSRRKAGLVEIDREPAEPEAPAPEPPEAEEDIPPDEVTGLCGETPPPPEMVAAESEPDAPPAPPPPPPDDLDRWPEALAAQPDDAAYLADWGVKLFRAGQLDGATAVYRRLAVLRPEAPDVQANLGYLALRQGSYQEAVRALEIAHRANPRLAGLQRMLEDARRRAGLETGP